MKLADTIFLACFSFLAEGCKLLHMAITFIRNSNFLPRIDFIFRYASMFYIGIWMLDNSWLLLLFTLWCLTQSANEIRNIWVFFFGARNWRRSEGVAVDRILIITPPLAGTTALHLLPNTKKIHYQKTLHQFAHPPVCALCGQHQGASTAPQSRSFFFSASDVQKKRCFPKLNLQLDILRMAHPPHTAE